MTNALVNYNAARKALALAHRVDEVKDIRDKAMAMQVYAKQAKDYELIDNATDIRMRAEIRAGELLIDMAKRKERKTRSGDKRAKSHPLLRFPTSASARPNRVAGRKSPPCHGKSRKSESNVPKRSLTQ